ncbi:B-cell receptor-associated 31-like protein [Microstroma glucosiphilum]|uniref:Endoplasmic reticulum transmembrane protein n=1 Tax=Pseudomicrostroma glucosiphilum TaxID=1684307 RepID=A0A316U842_9BASI|nr:B-cell receptor-associated 31-like protein [Pseudomicrostroma glucosiphilum]PWN21008.1 B-cell receptor-associated 31-like protein [Pseudomicrostroma glucosiphilum]
MTLYYGLVFGLLVLEVVTFLVLIIPLPFAWRRSMFKFLATNPLVAKAQYALKIMFIFVAVLFVDAVQRMWKVTTDGETMRDQAGMRDSRTESSFHAKKFYAQRNTYLTGFTLFLSLILSRTYSLITELITTQEELVAAKGGSSSASSVSKGGASSSEAEKLKVQLDNLKKQTAQQQTEYNRLADELAAAKGQSQSSRSD